ncbi:MAG: 2-oxoglutarate oxidoreductase [Leptolinea sp.]|jgi:2-oxoglutarate ferredoxin oxidoreductase subunit beta|nr:2-oxoglutarate oxidoreductase [Leptolinea sp.]
MTISYARPSFLSMESSGFCPGCGHGTVHNIIAEVVDELKIREKTMIIHPVGCGTLGLFIMNLNVIGAAHGRASAIATAIKRCNPDNVVICYQGDGDLAAIGMAETMYAANRGESISVIFINNTSYGMTGGQMAPTTMVGQKATTCQNGRDVEIDGMPFKMSELIASLDAPRYVTRVAVHDAKNAMKARKAIKKSIEMQINGEGYSFVEVITMCPTNWKMSPVQCAEFIDDTVLKVFPLGVFKS